MKNANLDEKMQQEVSDFLTQHDRLFRGVLKKCNIYYNSPDYDDYYQIARLAYVERYLENPEEELTPGYVFQYLVWRVIEAQRKARSQQELQEKIDTAARDEDLWQEVSLEGRFFFQELWRTLDHNERRYLTARLLVSHRQKDIGDYWQVSGPTLRKWRHRLQQKAQNLLDQ